VVDLLDYDVRFGQGFLFALPRPLRPEGAPANGGASSNRAQESHDSGRIDSGRIDSGKNGSGRTAAVDGPGIDPSSRTTGNAALARRATGPG
jgi:cyclic-di-GMP phosphodiesterase, flagellum assembly factor TipF